MSRPDEAYAALTLTRLAGMHRAIGSPQSACSLESVTMAFALNAKPSLFLISLEWMAHNAVLASLNVFEGLNSAWFTYTALHSLCRLK